MTPNWKQDYIYNLSYQFLKKILKLENLISGFSGFSIPDIGGIRNFDLQVKQKNHQDFYSVLKMDKGAIEVEIKF